MTLKHKFFSWSIIASSKRIFLILPYIFLLTAYYACNPLQTNPKTVSSSQNEIIQYDELDIVTRGYLDRSGNMWFTTTREGIFKYDGNTFSNYTVDNGLCGNDVWAIMEDKEDVLWLGTENGLCRFDGESFLNTPLPKTKTTSEWVKVVFPQLNPTGVRSIIQDKNGVFWIGTNGAGVYTYDGKTFTSYLQERGKLFPTKTPHNVIQNILEDKNGHIWCSSFSQGGISQFNGNNFTHHNFTNYFGKGTILHSYKDSKGHLWFATRSRGVFKYDGQSFQSIRDMNSAKKISVSAFLEDHSGYFWAACYSKKCIYIYNGKSFIPFEFEGFDKMSNIKCIAEDKAGNIWFGGSFGGLWRYDGKKVQDFTEEKRKKIGC